jgi:hypothetical protein
LVFNFHKVCYSINSCFCNNIDIDVWFRVHCDYWCRCLSSLVSSYNYVALAHVVDCIQLFHFIKLWPVSMWQCECRVRCLCQVT